LGEAKVRVFGYYPKGRLKEVSMEVSSISEQLLFTTVRIETQDASGNHGTGTSFVFGYESDGKEYPFLVTNKHIISGAQKGRLIFIQTQDGQPLLGTGYILDIDDFEHLWYGHPDQEIDIVVTPFVPLIDHITKAGVGVFYRVVGSNLILSEDALKHLDALEEVVFIGYPSGIWDTKNLLPIIRKGITATPIAIDFQGKSQFLIDASVFPGSSGSPVFLYNVGMYAEKSGGTIVGSRLFFLGAVASVFFQQDANEIRILSVPTVDIPIAMSRQMIDLGIVFKASTIVAAIEACLREKGLLPR